MAESLAIDPFRARVYRAVFAAAGGYNLAFGAWAGFRPLDFFRLFRLEPPRYPAVWACLGMVVGIYGLLYLYAARRLDRAEPIVAVGLLGKVLGPAGLLVKAAQGELPARMLSLLVLNDLIWWLPFGLFLLERRRGVERLRSLAPWACAALHAAALAAMALLLRGGTEVEPELARRAGYIREHPGLWRLGWATWMMAAVSLPAFCAWWGARTGRPRLALAAVLAAGTGMAFDLVSESLFAAWLPGLANELLAGAPGAAERFAAVQGLGTGVTTTVANSLYTAACAALTLATPSLTRWERAVAWTAWTAGAALTLAGALAHAAALVASSAVLFPAFVVVCVLVWRRLR